MALALVILLVLVVGFAVFYLIFGKSTQGRAIQQFKKPEPPVQTPPAPPMPPMSPTPPAPPQNPPGPSAPSV